MATNDRTRQVLLAWAEYAEGDKGDPETIRQAMQRFARMSIPFTSGDPDVLEHQPAVATAFRLATPDLIESVDNPRLRARLTSGKLRRYEIDSEALRRIRDDAAAELIASTNGDIKNADLHRLTGLSTARVAQIRKALDAGHAVVADVAHQAAG